MKLFRYMTKPTREHEHICTSAERYDLVVIKVNVVLEFAR